VSKFYFFYSSFMDYAIKTRKKDFRMVNPDTGRPIPSNLSPQRFYEHLIPELGDRWYRDLAAQGHRNLSTDRTGKTWLQATIEAQWYQTGRPEYKVHPGMVEALAHTNLDIPVTALQLPYPVFAVRLPSKHLREFRDAPFVRAILVSRITEVQFGQERNKLVFSTNFSDMAPGLDPMENNIITKVDMGAVGVETTHTIDWYLDNMPDSNITDGMYWPSREMTREIVALATAVALIGIGADRNLVRPAGAEGMSDRMARQRIERRHGRGAAGTNHGFDVGQDIKLPRMPRRYDRPDEESGEGPRLNYGHIRSGHMKMQAHGPRRSLRKLIFVAPCIVRPDLPLKPKSTPHMVEPSV